MPLKDDLEAEWIDELVDAICDKVEMMIPEWQMKDFDKANYELNKDEPDDYWRGYNAGIADLKLLLDSVKERQD
jgi:hypothetical protein